MVTSRKRTVEIDVVVDDKQASSQLKAIGTDAQKSAKGFSGLSTGMKATAVAAGAFVATKVVDFLGDSVRATIEDEKSKRLLALALENVTGATEQQIEAVETWIDGMSRSRGVADDELRPALANLVRASGDVESAQDDLGVAMDIAAARGLDLNTVTMAMSKAQLGNVGALGRLGIATKNTAGETLTYDEVLKEASRTMGGAAMEASQSLEGQLKRQQIAWEETKETIGAQVIPILTEVGDVFSSFTSGIAGPTERSINNMQILFRDLAAQGIDPNLDPMRTFVSILVEAEKIFPVTSESVKVLSGMLDLQGKSMANATRFVKENGVALGLNEEQVKNLIAQLHIEDQAARDAARGLGVSRGALEENTEATYANIDAIKELVDPLFGVVAAERRLQEATQKYTTSLIENGETSQETETAAFDLAKAQLDANAAAARYAEEGGPASVDALIDLAREAGLSEEEIRRLIAAIDEANRTPLNVPRHRSSIPGGPGGVQERHSGGHVPGVPGSEVPIMARAGEFVSQGGTPAHGNGHSPMVVQVNVDGKRFIEELVVPQLARYSRRNGGLGF